ncbi:MAG: T9SS C-terminal target domain-containing protein, partial [Sphingobacteriales bacterium]
LDPASLFASADANQDAPLFFEGQTFLFGLQEGGLEDLDGGDGTFRFVVPFSSLAAPVSVGVSVVALAHSTSTGNASTSEFSQASVTSLLPVQFVSFKAELQSDKVLVSWATAQEQNASHFDVERSTNGRDFTKIGQVKAAGNSNVLVNYSFTDNNPVLGVSYYRLRQVDIDNRFVYTKTVIIRNEARSKAFTVWPNPVLDNVNVTLQSDKNQNLNLRVVDYNGRVVRSQVVNATRGVNQITVNMSTLTKGMYVIQVVGDNLNLTEKVIKQ